jgi:leukotriene-A4 hydrolase
MRFCSSSISPEATLEKSKPITRDIHSYGNPEAARVVHVNLDLEVVFGQRTIRGTAVLKIEHQREAKQIVLDSRALQIDETEISPDGLNYHRAHFSIGGRDEILGAPVTIDVAPDTKFVRIRYATAPTATALQWLGPEQTAGRDHPFLYTQSQAIHARSWIPIQDSPGVRVTYEARIHTPAGLKAVMSATNCPDASDCHFVMDQPVPAYLIALAVGNLSFRPTGPRTGVWAEPEVADSASLEFSDMEKMLEAAERLYGPYRWTRYDVLVLPPSFPFGGMENPRLTFTTPTIIAGDKSLVSLIAHEVAHSWSGNLVTNATWSDFWLNEGFTVYIERRILEELYGPQRAEMEAALGYQELAEELKSHSARDQILHIDLTGRDPDDGATQIPYEKGALFLRQIERAFGRQRFDTWLKSYFDHFAFQSITTTESLAYFQDHLFVENKALGDKIRVDEWIFKPGLPQAEAPQPEAFAYVDKAIGDWMQGRNIMPGSWSTQEWLYFLHGLPEKLDLSQMRRLDTSWKLTESQNNEILQQWLMMSVKNDYQPAYHRLEEFLTTVGRRKYVKPLYEAMDVQRAAAIYEKARPVYHPITQKSIDAVLAARKCSFQYP